MYQEIIRPALFALSQGDAEKAHLLLKNFAHLVERIPFLLRLIEIVYDAHTNPQPVQILGTTFPNRVGLAAGMDKDGTMVPLMQALGFGFLEIGTVLPWIQSGNPRPRVFRLEEHEAIINRLGFNSLGAFDVHRNLHAVDDQVRVPLLISVGKRKDTPLENAAHDHTWSMDELRSHASVWVLNVSSPNTPDLRKLQGRTYLENLLRDIVAEAKDIGNKPVLVKIAPDLSTSEVEETVDAALTAGAAGFIVCNTTITRPFSGPVPVRAGEQGGLSGKPVFPLMIEKLRQVRQLNNRVPVIAVGGINSRDRGKRAFDEGADLIQIMTGLVYEGPRLVTALRSIV